jgi:radical SAM protein with 4Fe4S-binding SPASM domain
VSHFRFFPDCQFYEGPICSAIYDLSRKKVVPLDRLQTVIIKKFLTNATEDVINEHGEIAEGLMSKFIGEGFGQLFGKPVFSERLDSHCKLNLGNLTASPLQLRTVYLQVSDACNCECPFCKQGSLYHWQGCNSCLRWVSKNNATELDPDSIKSIVLELQKYNPKRIVFSGGNPILKWNEIKSAVIQLRSSLKDLKIQINTSGWGLTSEIIREAQDLDMQFSFSIFSDSYEGYKTLTGEGEMFNSLLECIEYCHHIELGFSLCLVICQNNRDKFPDVYEFALSLKSNDIYTTELIPIDNTTSLISSPVDEKRISEIDSSVYFLNQKLHPCLSNSLAIASDGTVLACPMGVGSVGNIYTEYDLHYCLKNDLFDEYWSSTKNDVPTCKSCEYRFACQDCAILEKATINDPDIHDIFCSYLPDQGIWNVRGSNDTRILN